MSPPAGSRESVMDARIGAEKNLHGSPLVQVIKVHGRSAGTRTHQAFE
jgi:hypothetical protein